MSLKKGSDIQFDALVQELAKNAKRFEAGEIKYYAYADMVDKLYSTYGWSKEEFEIELKKRLNANRQHRKEKSKQ